MLELDFQTHMGAHQPVPFYLTFDVGTTALKVALVDQNGRVAAIRTVEYSFHSRNAGWAELEPETYWHAVIDGTRSVLEQSRSNPSEVSAIGFSSQGQTFIPINNSGQCLSDAIVWVDNRAQAIVDSWEADWLPRDDYRRISGYPRLHAELTIFKIAWLARNAPEAHSAWKFLCLPDYLAYRLTGEVVTDCTTAQFTGLFNLHTRAWDSRLLSAARITAGQMPEVLPPGSIAGYVRADAAAELGIPKGVPVCVGANDQLAGAIGAGNVHPGIVSETTGTALALVTTTEKLLDDPSWIAGRHATGAYFAMPYANTSAIVLKWFRDICAPEQDYDSFLAGIESIPIGCDELTVVPHFAGTGSPAFNPDARGVFAGLTLSHTRLHLARGIMESCACILKECLDIILGHGLHVGVVRSLGGAARSDFWLQIKADMLGLPVERPLCSDAASLGAAMLAAAGVGNFATVEEASEAWYRPARVFEPNPEHSAAYHEVYSRYGSVYDLLYGGSIITK
ncbi:MAG: FGGY family carbohydrate kinase [Armatimonadetes bacterium]|nr:FGGY family carbohydrate kinase [Armatimonadota bacterium]